MSTVRIGDAGVSTRTDWRVWIPCLGMALCSWLSFVDRQVLGALAPTILKDTGLDAGQFAIVNSYFFVAYTIANPLWGTILDYVGLLCLKTAKSGGISQNVSGFAAIEALRQDHPDVLEVLSQPLHVDRRGGTRDGVHARHQRPASDPFETFMTAPPGDPPVRKRTIAYRAVGAIPMCT